MAIRSFRHRGLKRLFEHGDRSRIRADQAAKVRRILSSKKARRSWGEARAVRQVATRTARLLKRIRELKAEHPFWGYRRIWAHLRFVDGLEVDQKRVYSVMKAAGLLVRPNLKLRASRMSDTRIAAADSA